MQENRGALVNDVIGEVVNRCARADMRNLLLVCKEWSRVVPVAQPRCSLMLVKHARFVPHPDPRENVLDEHVDPDVCCRTSEARSFDYETSFAHVKNALATTLMRDAVVCGSGLDATAFAQWKHISCLQLCCMRDGACLGSLRRPLRDATLRALRLAYVRFDAAGEAALCAALASMVALEWMQVKDCHFAAAAPGEALYDALLQCAALRRLEFGGVCGALLYAGLPQLESFSVDMVDDFTSPDPPPVAGLKHLALREPALPQPWLARFLALNASIEDLVVDSQQVSSPVKRAIKSMTGVTSFTASKDGTCLIQDAAWTAQLTDASLFELHVRDTNVLQHLAGNATQLTSLELHFDDHFERCFDAADKERLFEAFASIRSIGQCTALRTLRLWNTPGRSIYDDFMPALCVEVLQPLTRLTQLVIAPGGWYEDHKRLVRAAAACDVEFGGCDGVPRPWANWVSPMPAKYQT